jgi:N-methylhydantoinase A
MLSGAELSADRIAAEVEELIRGAAEGLSGAEPELVYELRYAGQAFELAVPGRRRPEPAELIEGFEREHESLYGHRDPEGEVVLVHIRLAMVAAGSEPRPVAASDAAREEPSRPVRFDGDWVETRVLRGEPRAGAETEGPAVFELPESTFVVPPGWSTKVDEAGTIVASRGGGLG